MAAVTVAGTKGVLNETTMTVHRQEPGVSRPSSACGHTYHMERGQLREIAVKEALDQLNATKCGICFDSGRGY